jgi:hypothetical protein
MPVIRVFGLAMLAALTAMCLAVTPAAADETIVLCTVNKETCKAENYAGEGFTASHPAQFYFGGLGEFTCSSTMIRDGAGLLKELSFTECGEGCTVTPGGLPYKAELATPTAGSGQINISDSGKGEPKLTVACGGIECVYGLGVIEAWLEGGKPAVVYVGESMTRQTESFFCPKTAEWEASYFVSSPTSAVYMVNRAIEGPMFCALNEKACPQKAVIKYASFKLQPKSVFTITKLVGGSIECAEAGFLLHDSENPYLKGPWRFKVGLIDECTHPVYSSCEVDRTAPTYYAHLFPFGNGDGEVSVVAGVPAQEPALQIQCVSGTPFECVYSTEEFWLEFTGGKPGTMQETALMARISGSKTFCPVSILVEGGYEVQETGTGTILYLTET